MSRLLLVLFFSIVFSCPSWSAEHSIEEIKAASVTNISSRDAVAVLIVNNKKYVAKIGEKLFSDYEVKEIREGLLTIESSTLIMIFKVVVDGKKEKAQIFYKDNNERANKPMIVDQEMEVGTNEK